LPVAVGAALLAGPLSLAMSTRAHTASHNALTGNSRLDRFILPATLTFVGGISSRYWLHSHLRLHHPAPNVLGYDNDCDLQPTFCLNAADVAKVRPSLRWLFRFQLGWLVLLLPLNLVNVQRQGLAHWLRERPTPGRARRAWVVDGLTLLLHVLLRFVVPLLLHVSFTRVVTGWAVWVAATSMTMFAVFAPGHYPHEARVLAGSERGAASFWLRQTATTMNFRTGPIGAFVCGGLEYQIEHHLFPGYSHVHYAKMAPHVRAFCDRHGLPYAELGWGRALIACLRPFVTPKPVVDDVEALLTTPRGGSEPADASRRTA
jgi:fatty acid desaturase